MSDSSAVQVSLPATPRFMSGLPERGNEESFLYSFSVFPIIWVYLFNKWVYFIKIVSYYIKYLVASFFSSHMPYAFSCRSK